MTTNKTPLSEKRRNVAWEEINDREGDVVGYNYSIAFKEEDVREAVRRLMFWEKNYNNDRIFRQICGEIFGKELCEEEKQDDTK